MPSHAPMMFLVPLPRLVASCRMCNRLLLFQRIALLSLTRSLIECPVNIVWMTALSRGIQAMSAEEQGKV